MSDHFSAYDNLHEGVQVLSATMEYVYLNQTVCDQARLSRRQLLGRKMQQIYPGIEHSDMFKCIVHCHQTGEPQEIINEFGYDNGDSRFFALRMQLVSAGVLIFSFDITEKVLSEEKLKRQNFLLKQKNAALKRLNKELQHLSVTDELTGLYNRRYFMQCLREEVQRFSRYQQVFCVCIMDLDDFKNINDTYGHDEGDRVLKTLSQVLNQKVRSPDVLARFGGEEFVLLMPNTCLGQANKLFERVQSDLRGAEAFDIHGVTFSTGIAQADDQLNSVDKLLKASDEALYKAKDRGKNQLVIANC